MKVYDHLFHILNTAINEKQTSLAKAEPKEMYEPMSYIIGLGGKRIRPLLTLIGCDLFDVDSKNAIHASLSVELFHNFSLIHDDILDHAPIRRGKKTVHEKWNTPIAILSGDGMMVEAFGILAQSNPTHLNDLLQLFSKTGLEVCEGQQIDMNFESLSNVSVEEYIHMITFKTAVLLGASLQMGAICANASNENQNHVYQFGKHVGIAFQLLDDMLDVYADNQKFGKQVGGDIISNKKTYLLLRAFQLANPDQEQELNRLLSDTSISNSDKIKHVTEIYDALQVKKLTIEEANNHTDIALNHLNKIVASESKKENLKQFALQLLNRDL